VSRFNAQLFVAAVRQDQAQSTRSLRGRSRISPRTRLQLHAIALGACLHFTFKRGHEDENEIVEATQTLIERFEALSLRHGQYLNDSERQAVTRYLLTELDDNASAIDMPLTKLAPTTAYAGSVVPKILREFPKLAATPSIIKRAINMCPADPGKYLRNAQENIAALPTEEAFSSLKDTPWIFTYAAINHPASSRQFLLDVITNITMLSGEKEFADLAHMPDIIRYAAVHNPKNPRDFLRKVQTALTGISMEADFLDLPNLDGATKRAAAVHPQISPDLLRKALRTIRRDRKGSSLEA